MTTSLIPLGTPYKDSFSASNTQAVLAEVRRRFPEWADQCEPYVNVLTLRAWNQRGYYVKKGEKSISVATRIPVWKEDEATGKKVQVGTRLSRAFVFALPQVERRPLPRSNTNSASRETVSAAAVPTSTATMTNSPATCTSDTCGTTSGSSMH